MINYAYNNILTDQTNLDSKVSLTKFLTPILAKNFEPGSFEQGISFPLFGMVNDMFNNQILSYSDILNRLMIILKPDVYSTTLIEKITDDLERIAVTDTPDLESIYRAKTLLKNSDFYINQEVRKLDLLLGDVLVASYRICAKTFLVDGGQRILQMLVDECGEEAVTEIEQLIRTEVIKDELSADFYKKILAIYGSNQIFETKLQSLISRRYVMNDFNVDKDVYLNRPL